MMDTSLLSDVVAYSAQVACVVAIGGALTAIVRIDAAGVRYFYWRALLALCLALPWLQVRQTVTPLVTPASAHRPWPRPWRCRQRQWTGLRSLAGF